MLRILLEKGLQDDGRSDHITGSAELDDQDPTFARCVVCTVGAVDAELFVRLAGNVTPEMKAVRHDLNACDLHHIRTCTMKVKFRW